MTRVARVVAGVLGLLVWATSAPAQSLSATPTPFGQGATITVSAQSDTPPPPGTDMCGSGCYVLASYTFVYVEGSNGFTGFAEAYDAAAQYTGYDAQPGQTLTATTYDLESGVWLEVCTSWGWGQCLASDYWPYFSYDAVTVTPTAVPTADGVWPSSGPGPSQTFTLQ